MRVHVIVAHPDDEVLGVGGAILRHRDAGDRVRVTIACTAGLRGDGRVEAAHAAAAAMGTELEVLEYDQLGYRVPEFNVGDADIVYTHHPGDLNRDHRLVAEGARVACRPYASGVRSLRFMDTASSTEWGEPFRPSLYVDLTGVLWRKLDILTTCYESELREPPHPRSTWGLKYRARYWGSIAGLEVAEAFAVERETW